MTRGNMTIDDVGARSTEVTLNQNSRTSLQIPGARIRSVAVNNFSPSWIHFPDNPLAYQWIPPNTINAVVPIPALDSVKVNSIDLPPGFSAPVVTTLSANIIAYEAALPAAPGIPVSSSPALVPNKTPATWNIASLASGASSVIIAAVAGQTVYIFGINWLVVSVAGFFGEFQDTAGTTFHPWGSNVTADILNQFYGAPLAVGRGFQIKNTGTAAGQSAGSVVYSQA